jgi:hypothetical protein
MTSGNCGFGVSDRSRRRESSACPESPETEPDLNNLRAQALLIWCFLLKKPLMRKFVE